MKVYGGTGGTGVATEQSGIVKHSQILRLQSVQAHVNYCANSFPIATTVINFGTHGTGWLGMKIGTTIRAYRLQKGLSQGDIEKKTGLLRCYLSRVENGHTVPSLDTLAKIAHALDLPIAQFFASDTLARQLNAQNLYRRRAALSTQIRRYSSNLNDSDRKLLLAMVKKFAATATKSKGKDKGSEQLGGASGAVWGRVDGWRTNCKLAYAIVPCGSKTRTDLAER